MKMKRKVLAIALFLGLHVSLTAAAQSAEQVTLRVPNFLRPLAERWVSEYQQTGNSTGAEFQFATGKAPQGENSITLGTGDEAVSVARYAVLPVTTKASEAEWLIGSRKLNTRRLKSLFFVQDEDDDEQEDATKAEQTLHIYTGNSQWSAARTYAAHFGEETADYKGKKISGDDSYLNQAISRDPLGVTVNALPNVFDLGSRRLRTGLALLPLDLDRQGRQVLSEGRLDDILQLLEEQQYGEIPVSRVGLVYNHRSSAASDFVRWVLTHGTQYVHDYGLLGLPQKELTAQLRRMEQTDLAQK